MIAFKTQTFAYHTASLRYRALLPMFALAKMGIKTRWLTGESISSDCQYDTIVFVKAFTPDDVALAERAYQQKKHVFLDVCDNLFAPQYGQKSAYNLSQNFQKMAIIATGIITTNQALSDVISQNLLSPPPIYIIPDGIVPSLAIFYFKKFVGNVFCMNFEKIRILKAGILLRFKSFIQDKFLNMNLAQIKKNNYKIILWFGNHGSENAEMGMQDILMIKEALIEISKKIPLKFLIVSNNREKFDQLVNNFPFETLYREWTVDGMEKLFKVADLCVIPNSLSAFTACKSANRAILSLQHGVPVVATKTAALEVLSSCIIMDDWNAGIMNYLSVPDLVQKHIDMAKSLLESEFSVKKIGLLYQKYLSC